MARKEKDFNYHDAPVDELIKRLEKSSQDLFKLRFRAASAPVKNPMQIRGLRREIARLNTFINQRAAEQKAAPVAATTKVAAATKEKPAAPAKATKEGRK
jgi:large subunit ribosomal protein L29